MFTLNIKTDAEWLELPQGVHVLVKPLKGVVAAAAQTHALQAIRRMEQERADRVAMSAPVDGLPDLSDPVMREVMIRWEYARGLGRYGIIDFTGVYADDGSPVVFTPAWAEAIAVHPDLSDAFVLAYCAQLVAVTQEGNASAPAPNGSSAPGAAIATGAPMSARPVPVH